MRALCRLSDGAHLDVGHSGTKQHGGAEEPSGSGTERLQCQRNGENDVCVPTTSYCCVPHHTCRLIYSLTVSATETARQHQVCLSSSSLITFDHSFCLSFELADCSRVEFSTQLT